MQTQSSQTDEATLRAGLRRIAPYAVGVAIDTDRAVSEVAEYVVYRLRCQLGHFDGEDAQRAATPAAALAILDTGAPAVSVLDCAIGELGTLLSGRAVSNADGTLFADVTREMVAAAAVPEPAFSAGRAAARRG